MSIAPFAVQRDSSAPSVAIVRLEQPGKPVVVLDRGLIERLEATLRSLPAGLTGLVLASASERVFVAGADLKSIQELDDAGLHGYLEYGARVFGMLAKLPFPTVAAINGAALGGGLELAMHCDGLVAAPSASGKPYPVGLPEAGLSICPGWGGTNLLPARMEPGEAIRRTAKGEPMTFVEAKAAGLFDAVAGSAGELIGACVSWVSSAKRPERDGAPLRWIGRATGRGSPAETVNALVRVRGELPETDSARAVAEAVNAGLTRGWEAALQVERDRLVHLRNTPAGKAAIEAFFARSGGKG